MMFIFLKEWGQRLALLTTALFMSSVSSANDFLNDPSYNDFKYQTMQKYGLSNEQIDQAMFTAQNRPNILKIMEKPGESKPWYQYQSMFLVDSTIGRGVRFKNQYADALNRAEQQFGVPKAIILGILGVETGFGQNKGNIITRDALATLAFGYPRRSEYFKDELAALIAWSYKEGYPTDSIVGSYAGAIGFPQFMPSNISKYGVDYDGSGHIDLRNSAPDAIASIANYLAQHGWHPNQPIAVAAQYTGNTPDAVVSTDLNLPVPYGALQQQGVSVLNQSIDPLELVSLIQLQGETGPIYYITFPNFKAITTYNRSRMYATAVWQLGTAVDSRTQ
ncbi:lytic murein transglycosylase B [Acinetobacter rathckeae]|uniref:lytic murein transglycosylase B n=1 Tax=Acinetobacter rathckeae TaxID=2605272 RepID=UPI0018A31705|nr:lytic murein transglycosylase B [Acinetobacter rathckeae]MBF7687435.1 lytic murein transglycosylase B [Acinetobacter rathckeae]MBF7694836.1 lytic murein transglycosylase B [Acinetobacter rathckeae]